MIELNCPKTCPFMQRGEKSPVMPDGTPGGILFIGEAPGFEEVNAGHGFAGQAGKNLFNALEEIGFQHHVFNDENTFSSSKVFLAHSIDFSVNVTSGVFVVSCLGISCFGAPSIFFKLSSNPIILPPPPRGWVKRD